MRFAAVSAAVDHRDARLHPVHEIQRTMHVAGEDAGRAAVWRGVGLGQRVVIILGAIQTGDGAEQLVGGDVISVAYPLEHGRRHVIAGAMLRPGQTAPAGAHYCTAARGAVHCRDHIIKLALVAHRTSRVAVGGAAAQLWPALLKSDNTVHFTARSRSASSHTTSGFFPPISNDTFARRLPASSAMRRPTAVEPVKLSTATSGC